MRVVCIVVSSNSLTETIMTDEYIKLGREELNEGNPEGAIAHFEAAYALQPDNPEVLFYLGIAHSKAGQDDKAVEYYRQLLHFDAENADAWLNMANSYDRLGRYEQAEEAYATASNLDPEKEEVFLEWGICYYNQGRFEAALACTEQALIINPGSVQALWEQSDTLVRMEKFDEAAPVLEELVHRLPGDWRALYNLARCYEMMDCYDKVRPIAEELTRLRPENEDGYELLGNALVDTGKLEEALEQYSRALELCPTYWSVWANKGYVLLLLERFDEALPCYEQATSHVDDDAAYWYWNCQGAALHRLQRDDEALACYQRALELNPDYHLALSNMADVYMGRRAYDMAEERYLKAYEINGNRECLSSAMQCMYLTQRYKEMVQPLLALLPFAKEDGRPVAYLLGVAYKNLQEYEEAMRCFTLQLETFPEGPYMDACWFNIALCEKDMGHWEQAENALMRAMELFDSNEDKAMCYFCLGEIHFMQKHYEQALVFSDKAVRLDPDMDDYRALRKEALTLLNRSRRKKR